MSSKLSNITSAPLSPTPENSTPPIISPSSGFFSTVFSAAQNAANTISNSIANTSVKSESKGKNAKEDTKGTRELDAPEVESAGEKADTSDQAEQKELAVKTLGLGDLSLSQLGIPEVSAAIGAAMGSKSSDDAREKSDIDDESHNVAPQGVLGYSVENNSTTTVDEGHNLTRPRSMYEPSTAGDQTPPNGSVADIKANLQSTGSVRSAIGRKRRTRGSSAATGTAIGAAIAAANASVAHPSANNTPKITGFAVASKKRNRDFHQLFRSVPDDDYLIEDYSCALQREILAHGRLYVSEGHLCFSSNIFGWVTTLVMSFDEIVSVEKRSTALVFKNGLMISTLHSKNIFASFTSRDSTYDLIVGIWKLGHPSIHSSLNGVRLDGAGGGDKTEKDDILPNGSQSGSDSEGDSEDEDEVYDEDEEEDDGFSVTHGDWLISNQKCTDVTLEGGQMLTAENKVRTYSYIKPLYGAIGPKSTKCVCSENLDAIDLERAVSVTISTQTPDVPSGNVFSTKTKYCLTWAEGNSTRLQMNCTIEWTGKSWLKGPIEKGANDGQVQFAKDIIAALKVAISRRGASTAPNGTRGKKKGRKGREPKTAAEPTGAAADAKPSGRNLPFKGILGPVVDMVQPLLTPNVIYAVLIGLLIRIGMERLRDVRAMPLEAKIMDDKLRDQEMNAREVDDAIRVTEERLQLLKEVIKKKHGQENVGVEHVEI
ncbi:hypothetical protein DH86_00001335 [Scytalidium sp. 3C]|nr:hypothetical protein DH86_00001335 [Scytalidium sp. 3C]